MLRKLTASSTRCLQMTGHGMIDIYVLTLLIGQRKTAASTGVHRTTKADYSAEPLTIKIL